MYALKPKCLIGYKDGLLGIDNKIRLMFYYNLKSCQIEWKIWLSSILKTGVEEISVIDHCVILYPYWSNTLYCYNLETGKWKSAVLSSNGSCLYAHYIGSGIDGEYFFDTSKADILKIARDDFGISRYQLPDRLLHRVNGNDTKLYENIIILPVVDEDMLYVYDIDSGKSYPIHVGMGEKGYSTVAVKGRKIFLSGYSGVLACYELQTMEKRFEKRFPAELKVYSQEKGWDEKTSNAFPFVKSTINNAELWLFPYFTNMLCKFDMNTQEFTYYECKDVPVEKGFKPYDYLCKVGGNIYIRSFNGSIIKVENDELVTITMLLPTRDLIEAMNNSLLEDDGITLEEFIESI